MIGDDGGAVRRDRSCCRIYMQTVQGLDAADHRPAPAARRPAHGPVRAGRGPAVRPVRSAGAAGPGNRRHQPVPVVGDPARRAQPGRPDPRVPPAAERGPGVRVHPAVHRGARCVAGAPLLVRQCGVRRDAAARGRGGRGAAGERVQRARGGAGRRPGRSGWRPSRAEFMRRSSWRRSCRWRRSSERCSSARRSRTPRPVLRALTERGHTRRRAHRLRPRRRARHGARRGPHGAGWLRDAGSLRGVRPSAALPGRPAPHPSGTADRRRGRPRAVRDGRSSSKPRCAPRSTRLSPPAPATAPTAPAPAGRSGAARRAP